MKEVTTWSALGAQSFNETQSFNKFYFPKNKLFPALGEADN